VDVESWEGSLTLSRNIVQNIRDQLGLKLAPNGGDESYMVEPGIFTRNLMIPRYLKAPLISYLECSFYNNPDEFKLLANPKNPLLIDGQNVPYADRTKAMADAIVAGVLATFQ
jgi:hypothetical protein